MKRFVLKKLYRRNACFKSNLAWYIALSFSLTLGGGARADSVYVQSLGLPNCSVPGTYESFPALSRNRPSWRGSFAELLDIPFDPNHAHFGIRRADYERLRPLYNRYIPWRLRFLLDNPDICREGYRDRYQTFLTERLGALWADHTSRTQEQRELLAREWIRRDWVSAEAHRRLTIELEEERVRRSQAQRAAQARGRRGRGRRSRGRISPQVQRRTSETAQRVAVEAFQRRLAELTEELKDVPIDQFGVYSDLSLRRKFEADHEREVYRGLSPLLRHQGPFHAADFDAFFPQIDRLLEQARGQLPEGFDANLYVALREVVSAGTRVSLDVAGNIEIDPFNLTPEMRVESFSKFSCLVPAWNDRQLIRTSHDLRLLELVPALYETAHDLIVLNTVGSIRGDGRIEVTVNFSQTSLTANERIPDSEYDAMTGAADADDRSSTLRRYRPKRSSAEYSSEVPASIVTLLLEVREPRSSSWRVVSSTSRSLSLNEESQWILQGSYRGIAEIRARLRFDPVGDVETTSRTRHWTAVVSDRATTRFRISNFKMSVERCLQNEERGCL